MLVIYPILGINAFGPAGAGRRPDRLHLRGRTLFARVLRRRKDSWSIPAHSHEPERVESMPGWAAHLREMLSQSGTLMPVERGESLRLTTDYVFNSPFAAAAVLLGRSAAGPVEWKDEAGRTLKQIREQVVATAP